MFPRDRDSPAWFIGCLSRSDEIWCVPTSLIIHEGVMPPCVMEIIPKSPRWQERRRVWSWENLLAAKIWIRRRRVKSEDFLAIYLIHRLNLSASARISPSFQLGFDGKSWIKTLFWKSTINRGTMHVFDLPTGWQNDAEKCEKRVILKIVRHHQAKAPQ